ncbi:uncharacterized protein LOC143463183 isoform X1 [Clavelina lepadiformis]|uniref:uncharacterized protein LOC143463183 isoform X1 n=1 Tax=Clavelina lepadiformis TaxID=159417 RepID=UPI0040425617
MWQNEKNLGADVNQTHHQLIKHMKDMSFDNAKIEEAIVNTGTGSEVNDDNVSTLINYLIESSSTAAPTPSSSSSLCHSRPSVYGGRHRAVQIIKPAENSNGYTLDQDALERVFSQPQVANCPVSICSLAGAMREGKSFLLNLFLMYFHSGRSEAWLNDKRKTLFDGFGWRGGHNRCTQGIWIWDEPFPVNTKDGDVVVFLMDTQGAFDHESSIKGCSIIFALSTLISSVQIFNIMRQIQENHLQHLQLFTEYGKVAKQQNSSSQGKAFQSLMFLVRDWHNPAYRGLQGGCHILKDVLRIRNSHHDLTAVRENIHESFEDVGCMLLPKPGDRVEIRNKNGPLVTIGDMKPEFLDEVNELVKHLFKTGIVCKRVNDSLVTGLGMINLIIAYCNVFESGDMPDIQPIMEATAKAAIVATIQKCKDEYITEMKQHMEDEGFVEEDLLRKRHDRIRKDTISRYNSCPKMGGKGLIDDYRRKLSQLIEQNYDNCVMLNASLKEKMKKEIRDQVDTTKTIYVTHMGELCGSSYLDENTLNQRHCEISKQMVEFFVENTNHYPQNTVAEYKTELKKLIKHEFKSILLKNRYKEMEFVQKITSSALEAENVYTTIMDEKCEGKHLDETEFKAAHKHASEQALTKLISKSCCEDKPLHAQKKLELEVKIMALRGKYTQSNDMVKRLQQLKLLEVMVQIKTLYNSLMDEGCGSRYVDESEINRLHDDSKNQAEAVIMSIEPEHGKEFADKCRQELDCFLDDALQKISRKNDNFKREGSKKLKEQANKVFETFVHRTEEISNEYISSKVLENKLRKWKIDAVNLYESGQNEPADEFQKVQDELQKKLEEQCTLALSNNEKNQGRAKDEGNYTLQVAKLAYLTAMEQLCDGKYIEEATLLSYHQQQSHTIRNNIACQIQNAEIKNDVITRFDEEVMELFQKSKEKNKKNDSTWMWKTAKAAGTFLLSAGTAMLINTNHPYKWAIAGLGGLDSILRFFNPSDNKQEVGQNALRPFPVPPTGVNQSSSVDPPSYQETVKDSESTPSHANQGSRPKSKSASKK